MEADMDRRDFLVKGSAASLLACFPASLAGIERTTEAGRLERRALGRTGERLSIIGFGGIVVMNASTREAADRVAEAVDYGVNYFDVAPSYGNAEQMLGPALEPHRKGAFLACKTTERSRDGAQRELDNSLRTMRTDHFDLYQLHAVTTKEDVEKIFAPSGALSWDSRRTPSKPPSRSSAVSTSTPSSSPPASARGMPAASGRRCSRPRARKGWASWP
jgi:hypothetical protein